MRRIRFRPRVSVRRLMSIVAIAAVLMGACRWIVVMRSRSAGYERRAWACLERGQMQWNVSGITVTTKYGREVRSYEDENDWRGATWGREQALKYFRLSNYPWLPVEPDPPFPETLDRPRLAVDLPEEMAPPIGFYPRHRRHGRGSGPIVR